ncbi:hypothetical protein [Arthrobacter agilis]|uniref:hypothetical protein n=1 Tax=Arthrobacter agilis TaxID=37921 RepID=UPI00277D883A|nr:hypothetical protein [Arthrobacter agilis]MDQ0735376.1 hypothetical protein [Arthrobacter agilis]
MMKPRTIVQEIRPGRRARQAVLAAALAGLLLTSCSAPQDDEGSVSPPASASSTPEPTAAPLREAREGWKVFTDPGRLVSFELPEAWVVQPLEPAVGSYAPGSLHYAVRTPEGVTAAELHTGIVTPEPPCPEPQRTPYYVIGSEPLDPTVGAPATADLEPRFVVRLITGFRFFGSYGIADQVGGPDGLACSLSNTVQGSDALGRFSFGDLEVLAPKVPAETGPGTVSFGTIGEAEAYYAGPEFATIREMILSVQVGAAPAS